MPISVNTFAELIEHRLTLTAYCTGMNCRHSVALDLPALAAKLGGNFNPVRQRDRFAAMFVCTACGNRGATFILSPEVAGDPGGFLRQRRERLSAEAKPA